MVILPLVSLAEESWPVGAGNIHNVERTEGRGWELLGGGFNFRGSFGLDYFLTFATGNDIKYQ